jgi:hypothetical protein
LECLEWPRECAGAHLVIDVLARKIKTLNRREILARENPHWACVGALGFGTCRFPIGASRAGPEICVDDVLKPEIESHFAASRRRGVSRQESKYT